MIDVQQAEVVTKEEPEVRLFSRFEALRFEALQQSRDNPDRMFWFGYTWPRQGWCWTGYYRGEETAKITRKGRRYVPHVNGRALDIPAPRTLRSAQESAGRALEQFLDTQDRAAEQAELLHEQEKRRIEESTRALEASREDIAAFNARFSSTGRAAKL